MVEDLTYPLPEEDDTIADNFHRYVKNGAVSCFDCKHYRKDDTCSAFPAEIPDRYIYAFEVHRQVDRDQVGTFVFEKA